jgi:large subunit ribosomal protein L10
VKQYNDLMERSQGMIVTDYHGLNVTQITRLRNQVREAQGAYHVTKNTLIKLAFDRAGITVPDEWLEGPTAVGFCFEDVPPIAKAITTFANETEILTIKGGLLGQKPLSVERVKTLADLPTIDVLQSQVLGTLSGPLSGLIGTLNGLLGGLMGVFEARHDQLGETEAAS